MVIIARTAATAVLLLAVQCLAARLNLQRFSSSDLDTLERDASLDNVTLASEGPANPWPAKDTVECSSGSRTVPATKQMSMYGYPDYTPSLTTKPATEIRSTVIFKHFVEAPWIGTGNLVGGIFASYKFDMHGRDKGGYFGPQICHKGPGCGGSNAGKVLLSMWDGDRWDGGHKKPKASSELVWPLSFNCKRNCQDCGLASLKEAQNAGLTTGTKCELPRAAISKLGSFSVRFWRKATGYTIHTKDYGGFASAHDEFGEQDREVTGSRWVLELTDDATGSKWEVGDILVEGGDAISKLTMFDEHFGCIGCNDLYHSETRLGPFLHDADGTVRKPTAMKVLHNGHSTCFNYQVTGDKTTHSLTFDSGPGAVKNFEPEPYLHTVW